MIPGWIPPIPVEKQSPRYLHYLEKIEDFAARYRRAEVEFERSKSRQKLLAWWNDGLPKAPKAADLPAQN